MACAPTNALSAGVQWLPKAYCTGLMSVMVALACLAQIGGVEGGVCGPDGSGLPACNGTVVAFWDSLNCVGNVTYTSEEVAPVPGECMTSDAGLYPKVEDEVCRRGVPLTVALYLKTPSDRLGNCTQPPYGYLETGPMGTCFNVYSANYSWAYLCDASMTPDNSPTGHVAPGPVALSYDTGTPCYAPDRCQSIYWTTTYNDGSCNRSVSSNEILELGAEVGVCYDLRPYGVNGSSIGNIQYSVQDDYFTITSYASGCDGPPMVSLAARLNTCYVLAPDSSFMLHSSAVAASPPPSDDNGPSTAVRTLRNWTLILGALLMALLL